MATNPTELITFALEVMTDAQGEVPGMRKHQLEMAHRGLTDALTKIQRMEQSMRNFIRRVEKGEIKSTATYLNFKHILEEE